MKSKKSIDLENKTKDSDAIYIARGIAILSVIAAHVNILDKTTAYSTLVTSGIMYFGQIGVVIFFLTGGFLYHREDHDTYIYFKRKLHTLILPWIVCSAITYIISAALSREISLLSYLRWGFGSGRGMHFLFSVFL